MRGAPILDPPLFHLPPLYSIRSLALFYIYFSFFLSSFSFPHHQSDGGDGGSFFFSFHIEEEEEEEERREHSGLSSTAERFGPLVPTSVGSPFLFSFFVVYVLLHFPFLSTYVKGVGTRIEEELGQDGRIAFLQQPTTKNIQL